ncbi:unnamed protein product, partial [Symbiodinium sp. CCMP2456]
MRRARQRDASLYLDYGYTRPNVMSRGPHAQQTDSASGVYGDGVIIDSVPYEQMAPEMASPQDGEPLEPVPAEPMDSMGAVMETSAPQAGGSLFSAPGGQAVVAGMATGYEINPTTENHRPQPIATPRSNVQMASAQAEGRSEGTSSGVVHAYGAVTEKNERQAHYTTHRPPAEACGVSRRTVFRDIESLREAGVPIEYDADAQRYRIDAAHFLPPTNLTLEEALSVVLLAGRVGELERDTLFAAAIGAAQKIEASLPSSMRERLSEVAEAIDLRPPPVNPLADKGDVYRALLRASVDQQAVRIRYDCRTEFREIETDLDPYHLLFQERSWYVIGRSSRHDEVRTFNIGRVK